MKLLSKIDIISPKITLYYKSALIHPSIFSGILSLIYYILMVCCGVYYLLGFFRRENSTAFFFNRYVEDSGNFSINSSAMFNFIQIYDTYHRENIVEIDFDSLRIIGIEKTIDTYSSNPDLINYNHWIYGKCNNDTDTKDIGYLITFNDYFQSACIRKYYNKNDGKYYDTTDINFKWPVLSRGCSNLDSTYYGIIVEKCKNDSLRINFDKKYCKSDLEINEYMAHVSIKLQFIDHFADVYNYYEPLTKYFREVTNGLFSETYTTNHLNFNPAIVETHTGFIFEKTNEKYAYFFEQNEKITSSTGNSGIYIAFYFWMQNSMQYYVRTYQLLQDALSSVGGITKIILSVANVINYIASYYVMLIDSEELFITQNESFREEINKKNTIEKQIKKDIDNINPKKKFHLYNNYKYRKNNPLSINNCMSKENPAYSKSTREIFGIYSNRNNMEKDNKKDKNKYLFYNKNNYFVGNNYFYYERKEQNNKSEIEQMNLSNSIKTNLKNNIIHIKIKDNINDKFNKNKFNFCKFLSYVISCCKNNQEMSYVKELRYKILSEETIIQSYLNLKEMNKLSKFIK